MWFNQLISLPWTIGQLSTLTWLDLSIYKITGLPDQSPQPASISSTTSSQPSQNRSEA